MGTSRENIGVNLDPGFRTARDQINTAVLTVDAGRAKVKILEVMQDPAIFSVLEDGAEIAEVLSPAEELDRKFQPLPYEMSEEDFARFRDFLTDRRLEILRETGELASSMPISTDKPHFVLRSPESDTEVDFELYAASYTNGRAVMLAHPELNNGWGCAIALGWEERAGVAEGYRVDFCGYTDVLLSSLPLLKKYGIEDLPSRDY